jgi:transcription termination factor Rho
MSILDRNSLEQSSLADLHAIASELSIDSFRRLRKAELIDAILARQAGEPPKQAAEEPAEAAGEPAEGDGPAAASEAAEDEESGKGRRRWRRGARGRERPSDEASEPEPEEPEKPVAEAEPEQTEKPAPRSRKKDAPPAPEEPAKREAEVVEGVVELLPGGSGFVRVSPPEPSDDDVYISSAQIKRCELVSGDRVSGPRRAPRRSERFASLVRVDTVNGRPASELADSVRFEDRPVAFPDRRLSLSGDPVLEAIDRLAPIGRGSRVTISGPASAGKTEALRRLARALSADESLQLWVALTGVRPEELSEWQQGQVSPALSLTFAASGDAQSQGLEGVVEQVRRLVARGADAVILIDTLDGINPSVARRAMASARNVVDGGSLTVIATSSTPVGGETTVIALEREGSAAGQPAIVEDRSWTIRRELLG